WLYMPSWQRTAQIGIDYTRSEQAGVYLILCDEHLIGTALASHLRMFGIEPIMVFAGTGFVKESAYRYRICPANLSDFNQLLQAIREEGNAIGHIFYLWSLSTEEEINAQVDSLFHNFYSLLFLARSLEDNLTPLPSGQKMAITIVANQLEDVTGSEMLSPEKALLYGPHKVIPQEYEFMACRLIDIELRVWDSMSRMRLAKQIFAESQLDN